MKEIYLAGIRSNIMRIAVYKPNLFPLSMNIYLQNVTQLLAKQGVKISYFSDVSNMSPDADIYWDPRIGGGSLAIINKSHTNKPIVITLHGAALFSIRISENRKHFSETYYLKRDKWHFKRAWKKYTRDYQKVITVSQYAKSEILKYISFPEDRVIPIYLAANTERLNLKQSKSDLGEYAKPYFLHLSVYQPKKNIDRIIKAYNSIAFSNDVPDLLIISPEFSKAAKSSKIKIINTVVSKEEAARYFKNAFAFIFPSLHETFGIPLVEAMSYGLPIVTSNSTACPEIVNKAALLVDPRSTKEIAEAIMKLVDDKDLRGDLRQKALSRSKDFSWEKCAEKHLDVFNEVLKNV